MTVLTNTYDHRKVNGATAIKLALLRKHGTWHKAELEKDLQRLITTMSSEEYTQYIRRVS